MSESIRFQYAVYLLPMHGTGTRKVPALLRDAMAKHPDLTVVEAIPEHPQAMLVRAYIRSDVKQAYAPPDMKALQYFGRDVSGEQAKALQDSSNAVILEFAHPKKYAWSGLRAADEFVEDIARKSGGLVWDEETREVFSPDAWHQKRLANWNSEIPDVSGQTVIHIYPKGEYARAITLGMSKMGLPDVVIEESPWSSKNQVGNLINIFCQDIAERGTLHSNNNFRLDLRAIRTSSVRETQIKSLKANAVGVACLSLVQGKHEEGDPKNRLVRLMADRYEGNDPHAKQDSMLSSFFGWEDSMVKIEHNPELLSASVAAKGKLPELRRAFNAGLKPGEFIDVKAPFPADNGGREWMWVEVTRWKANDIQGLLESDPFEISRLHSGQMVEVREEQVFDYIHQYADKRIEGNTTGEIIRKMSEGQVTTPTRPLAVPSCNID
jgi:uncharacterized protein YegJ (DUF2314 family)